VAATESAERTEDEAILHRLGYAQVLYREMGGFSNFAISFTIISILAGCLTSYFLAFNNGGPVAITWGWLIVGVFCVLVAMAMGEIASAMPTAGALYFWASKLGGPAWGWFTGWFNLVGQIAVTASIQYGSAIFATALLNLWFPDLIGTDTGATFITLTVIVALQLALNLLNVNVLALLNTVSAWWHMVGVVVVVGILIAVPERHQSAGFVFGEVINNSGFSATWFVFGLGLIMALYTITGYDASAHMSEETRQASRASALGMVMAVVVSVVFGFILLVAVTFAVPDVQGTADAAGNAVIYIWTESLGEALAEFLLLIAVVAQLFCGTASVTSASRMMFAFSRDRAVPFSTLWRKVAPNRVPVNAVTAISVLAWALMIPTLANGVVGYAVGTSIAVIGLYIAFALPIILRIKAGDRFEPGAWTLGKHYKWISPIAVGFIAVASLICLMPMSPKGIFGNEEFTWESVNYAPITVGGALVLFGGWYLLSARTWFTGPVREAGSEEELKTIEAQLEAEAHGGSDTGGAAVAAGTAATVGAVAVAEKVGTDTETGDDKAGEADKATDDDADKADDKADDAGDKADAAVEADAATDTAATDTAATDTAATDTAATDTAATEPEAGEAAAEAATSDAPTTETTSDAAVDVEETEVAAAPAAAEPEADAPATETTSGTAVEAEETAPSDTASDTAADTVTEAPDAEAAAATADAPATADTATADTATADTATEETAAADTAETAPGTEAGQEPVAEAAAEAPVAEQPHEEGGAATAAAAGAATAAAPAVAEEATTAPVASDGAPGDADADLRAQLKEELKAELKAELRAELLEELRREATTNGTVPASTAGTDAGASA
jgi:amino acid transporter